jgi:hypothetical protein
LEVIEVSETGGDEKVSNWKDNEKEKHHVISEYWVLEVIFGIYSKDKSMNIC